ncbi:unnamed protein product [Diatraea saccharalis]|uniref:Uncharacterized protein n=1 Tax=Diatraea saccharalis TaxID=40085 RepID=A0A9N9W9W9_9NEOP|nr:unnamed protein product [Diatraea saccharalis]
MAPANDNLDFSGLFKLDVLVHLDISAYTFYEVGLKKFLAFCSDKELLFFYINPQTERLERNYDWDFVDNPIHCMCFEPSGTWLLILSDNKVLLVPFLPLFTPQNAFDHKWSLSSVTVLPIPDLPKPISVVWWLTKESENVLIIGTEKGLLSFYCLESQSIVAQLKIPGEIMDLQMCFDDSLDLLILLISKNKTQHGKLILEHRSYGYNYLTQVRLQIEKEKKDGFMSYLRQLSKDKLTLLIHGGSKDDKSQSDYSLEPTEYLPFFRKRSRNWALSAQYLNGRHFLTAFELKDGTLVLESPGDDSPSRTIRPKIEKDEYIQALWSHRLVYLFKKNEVVVHSTSFSVIHGEALLGAKREFSELWSAELIGDVRRAHLMSVREPLASKEGWREPTFLCDLKLPRFSLVPCLIVTDSGAYILNTVCDPCEWLVGIMTRGGVGAEQAAAALAAPLPALLRAAADLLMSRGKVAPAEYLFSLSQSQPDLWVARLGVFGRLDKLSMYQPTGNQGLGGATITLKLLALLLKLATNNVEKHELNLKLTLLNSAKLSELSCIAAAIGLWDNLPTFSIHCGLPNLILVAVKARNDICRGALNCLLGQTCLTPFLLEEDPQWLFDYIVERSKKFDTIILKRICLWLNPLQDQLRPLIRDMKQGISSIYTTRMLQLIATFIHVACEYEARHPCPEICLEVIQNVETWKNQFAPRRSVSCGLTHWSVADDGNAKIMMTKTPIKTDIIGRVIDVACGRHHTIVLTENGVYSAGDNTYGQLGVGNCWAGGVGDTASSGGRLLHVPYQWTAPVVDIACGHYHSAAIDAGGRLYTWGWGVHGQLGHGIIDDEHSPRMVAKFQGRKVLSVGCGACHTVTLMKNGEVWACGPAIFGQLGSGNREKSSIPIRVVLPDAVEIIAAGYFHTLALTCKGQLYTWGASPQQVRAANARRTGSPNASPSDPPVDPHLVPSLVDTQNVYGRIVQIAAGWHHSCLINNMGTFYSWGLNFDGQLGSGDRKQVIIPTEVEICDDSKKSSPKTPEVEDKDFCSKALVACGGDFTVYVSDDGRVYACGNYQPASNNTVKEKTNTRVIMMKTTKRVIKIPAKDSNSKFFFKKIDRIDVMFPFNIEGSERKLIEPAHNPLVGLNDFNKKSWADDLILLLKPWISEEKLTGNLNMSAKFAFHNEMYSKCLNFLLQNLKTVPKDDCLYFNHTEIDEDPDKTDHVHNKDRFKITITNIMSKRIKEVSLYLLNEKRYPEVDFELFKTLPCCCDEFNYLPKELTPNFIINTSERNLSTKAANIIDECMSLFPVDVTLWETCFRLSKDFFIDNDLSVPDLETVLRKYMESNATTMADAIMYTNDCMQYSEILSPKFYLNMCSQVLDTWS